MDKQNLKNPFVWVITAVVILGIGTLYSATAMLDQRKKADKQWKTCLKVQKKAEDIQRHQSQTGDAVTRDLRIFQGEAEAYRFASKA